jgi:starch synthase
LRAIAARHPDRVWVDTSFTDEKEHRMMAGGDILLMPCRYEPCGLTQMRAQRYGTVPLVRRVGGLADTVHDGVTGFVFNEFSASAFAEAIARAIVAYRDRDQWFRMMRDAMARDFGWERSEERYRDLYRTVLSAR